MVAINNVVLSLKVMAFNLHRDVVPTNDIKNAWNNPSRGVWYWQSSSFDIGLLAKYCPILTLKPIMLFNFPMNLTYKPQ
jgi:hypothetical protein